MRRWLLRILVCLPFGAATTVAVAWGLSLWGSWDVPQKPSDWLVTGEDRDRFHFYVFRWSRTGSTTIRVDKGMAAFGYASEGTFEQIVPSWCRKIARARLEAPLNGRRFAFNNFEGRGWPFVAMWCEQEAHYLSRAPVIRTLGGIETDLPTVASATSGTLIQPFRLLPLRPIWPGFVIDTLFYAAMWGALVVGFTSAKRAIWRKRGRCPRCGYDLRGQRTEIRGQKSEVSVESAGCPECGWGRAPSS